ncbi:cell surface glycoprotein 1-like [Anopheles aquasalis]|uniref:cell surface glycoprotein 1-like n=1 Tax=Anopheles aquasalis TaxID=42839 RepID=UPI00215A8E72|nr:cell surface glycoprotein 1-like [Anopheles aquasalis]
MGLKLRWFRRRITFDGIPSAPERSIRRKEATSGTVIGVYRHSSHFEDYIEPVRSSYWEPPPQAIARATIRTSNPSSTSTNSPSSSSTSNGRSWPMTMNAPDSAAPPPPPTLPVPTTISSVSRSANVAAAVAVRSPVIDRKPDKIESRAESADSTRLSNGMHLETPPEPMYTPPLPPARKGLGKAKSLASLAPAVAPSMGQDFNRMPPSDESEDSDIYGYVGTAASESHLRSTQSVEVLTSISPLKRSLPSSPSASPIVVPIPRTRSTTSLTQAPPSSSPSLSSLSSTTSTVLEGEKPSPSVNKVLAASNESPSESEEPFQTIFERVQPRGKRESPPPERDDSPPATPTPPPQRKPVLVVSPTTSSAQPSPPHQPKSILKKRAPAPPPVEATSEIAFQRIPTAPPRTIRTLENAPSPKPLETPEVLNSPEKRVTATPGHDDDNDDDDDDDDFNWDFVQRHRSSIDRTVAAQTQIDPEVLRNAPAALKQPLPTSAPVNRNPLVEPIAQPRTLRGMRNQRARPQETRDWSAEPRPAAAGGQETHQGRASDSNASETSA